MPDWTNHCKKMTWCQDVCWWSHGVSHLIGFVVEKMNRLLGPSLSRMIAPFFLLAILAGGHLAILWCKYEIYQLHHSGWNCQMRPGIFWLWSLTLTYFNCSTEFSYSHFYPPLIYHFLQYFIFFLSQALQKATPISSTLK